MKQTHTPEHLSEEVYVTSQEPFTAHWDGKEYNLSPDKDTRLKRGIVYHWQEVHGVEFTMKDIPKSELFSKEIINPLEENDRGEAFASLKRPRKSKEGE